MRKIAIVGHSHIKALSDALAKDGNVSALFGAALPEIVSLRDDKFNPSPWHPETLDGELHYALRHYGHGDLVVLAIGGNGHNVLGLVNFKPRFDFILPAEPELPVDGEAELLPASLVEAAIGRGAARHLDMIHRVRRSCAAQMVHLESPPPIPSADHLERHPGIFKDKIAEFGAASPMLRYKLWRLYSHAVKSCCDALRVALVPVPPETQDASGTMLEAFWNPDPTHGNRHYGVRVMHQIHRIYLDSQAHARQHPQAASL